MSAETLSAPGVLVFTVRFLISS